MDWVLDESIWLRSPDFTDVFVRRQAVGCLEAALEGFGRQMKRLPHEMRKGMTYDRGSEMARHPDLSDVSQTWLNDIAWLMNGRSRKTLGWKTPAEAMAEEMAPFNSTVALDT